MGLVTEVDGSIAVGETDSTVDGVDVGGLGLTAEGTHEGIHVIEDVGKAVRVGVWVSHANSSCVDIATEVVEGSGKPADEKVGA